MNIIFNTLGNKLYEVNGHHGYLIKYSLFEPLCTGKWSRNRESDKVRVLEMLDFYNSGGYIPPIIHIAELDEGLVCYDGNHRRELFKIIKDVEDILIIVDVVFNSSQYTVYNIFENINKSVQVPAIYLDEFDNTLNIKEDIINLVKTYEKKYKKFISTSARPKSPNFNRDNFADNIYDIYLKFNRTLSIDHIQDLLVQLNESYSTKNNLPILVFNKCKKYNFWLFINRNISFDDISNLIKTIE